MRSLFFLAITFILFDSADIHADTSKGMSYYEKGSYELALKEFLKASEKKDIQAFYMLGVMHQYGRGVEQDFHQARGWLTSAIASNPDHKDAIYELALNSFSTGNTPEEFQSTIRLATRATELGHEQAPLFLGRIYQEDFMGQQADYEKSKFWYEKAAKQNNAKAQLQLGYLFYSGKGARRDYKQASKWFLLAAEQLNSDALSALGLMHEQGHGFEIDLVKAHMYFNLSVFLGSKDVHKHLSVLQNKMTEKQIEKAQQLAQEWISLQKTKKSSN